jgi:hypothetical protein
MLNEASVTPNPRQPESWGEVDPLPLGRVRENPSVLEKWRREGNLHPAVEAAAYEIENCFRALVGGLWTKTASYGEERGGGASTDYPARIAIAMKRYRPWRDEMALIYKRDGLPVHEVIIDVMIDGGSFRQMDAARRWRKGTASRMARWGLWEYARMAQWVKEKECPGSED